MLTKGGISAVLLLLKPRTMNKYVHNSDMFTALCVVILVSRFTPSRPLSSAAVRPRSVQIKAANSTTSVLTGCFAFPYYPQCFAVPHSIVSDLSSMCPSSGLESILHAQNKPNDLQLPSSHGLFGVTRRLDMMILHLQCKRIALQFSRRVLCTLQLNRSNKI